MRFTVFWSLCLSLSLFSLHSLSSAATPSRKKIHHQRTPSFFSYKSPCKGHLKTRGFSACSNFSKLDLSRKKYHHSLQAFQRALYGSSFEGNNLSGVHFNSTDLRYANFRNATLHHTIFEGVNLQYADFRGADLSAAIFINSTVDHTTLQIKGALFDEHTIFPGNTFDYQEFKYSPNLLQDKTDALFHGMISFSINSAEIEIHTEGLTAHELQESEGDDFKILTLKDSNRHIYSYKIYSEKLFQKIKRELFEDHTPGLLPAKIRIEASLGESENDPDTLLDFDIIAVQNLFGLFPEI